MELATLTAQSHVHTANIYRRMAGHCRSQVPVLREAARGACADMTPAYYLLHLLLLLDRYVSNSLVHLV